MDPGVAGPPGIGLALGPEPQAIQVAANPPHGIPAHPVAALTPLPFQLVEEHEEMHCGVWRGVRFNVGKRRRPVGIGDRWNGCVGLGRLLPGR